MIKEFDEESFIFTRVNNDIMRTLLEEGLVAHGKEIEKFSNKEISNEEISNDPVTISLRIGQINCQSENDYSFLIIFRPNNGMAVLIGTDKKDNLKDENIAFDLFIKRRKWESRKEFFNYCIYPYMISRRVSNKECIENELILSYIEPLKKFLKNPSSFLSTNLIGSAIRDIIKDISEGDLSNIKKISKVWKKSLNRKTIEENIFEYVFPNYCLEKPSPVEVVKLQSYLLENGLKVQRQAIQQTCNKMHIKRLGGKGGRPPKEKQ